jgi:hypothetical protein
MPVVLSRGRLMARRLDSVGPAMACFALYLARARAALPAGDRSYSARRALALALFRFRARVALPFGE